MVMAAHSYCLGQRNYIVGGCAAWLQQWWPDIEPNTRRVIVRDTLAAIRLRLVADGVDGDTWKTFIGWAWPQLPPEDQAWCRNQGESPE